MKKFLCLILALLLLCPTAFAAEDLTFSFSKAEGKVGETVTIVVASKGAPVACSYKLVMTYDDQVLKPTAVKNINSKGFFMNNLNTTYEGKPAVNALTADANKAFEGDCELYSVSFEILSAPENGTAKIEIPYYECYDADLKMLDAAFDPCEIKVLKAGETPEPGTDTPDNGKDEPDTDTPDNGKDEPEADTPDNGKDEPEADTPDNGKDEPETETPDNGKDEPEADTPDNGKDEPEAETPDNGKDEPEAETPDNGKDEPEADTPDNGKDEPETETPDNGKDEPETETPDNGKDHTADQNNTSTDKEGAATDDPIKDTPASGSANDKTAKPENSKKPVSGDWMIFEQTDEVTHSEDGDVIVYKGEFIYDDDENNLTDIELFDEEGKPAGSVKVEKDENGNHQVVEQHLATDEPEKGFNHLYWIIPAAIVLLAGAVAAVMILKNKKKEEEIEE